MSSASEPIERRSAERIEEVAFAIEERRIVAFGERMVVVVGEGDGGGLWASVE